MATKGDISDLDVLVFGGKPVVPLVSGFSRERNDGVNRSNVAGGAGRQRKKYYGTTHSANASFYLQSPQMQDFFQLFINRNMGKRWICHLSADRPIVEPYVVQTLANWNHDEVNAVDGHVTVPLEIFSVRDSCLDDLIFPLYQCYGDELPYFLWLLDTLTDRMPRA